MVHENVIIVSYQIKIFFSVPIITVEKSTISIATTGTIVMNNRKQVGDIASALAPTTGTAETVL